MRQIEDIRQTGDIGQTGFMRLTEDVRQKKYRRLKTGDVKQTGNRRYETVDRIRETRGMRQHLVVRHETDVVRQET